MVIDLNNHPIKDSPDLPLTLSSKMKDALIEAGFRIDTRIAKIDRWAGWLLRIIQEFSSHDGY